MMVIVSRCSDESDEQDCKLLVLQSGYNKDIPQAIKRKMAARKKELLPVNVSLDLLKVIDIDEIEYSFSFKFKISLMWRDNRVTFKNLKNDSTYNLLRQNEVKMIWLPLVIYWNTDQHETTRLGAEWEWSTDVWVQREGYGSKNSLTEIHEAEIFQGEENSLRMEQIYAHDFQNSFHLFRYPFDTQVQFLDMEN